MPVSSYSAKQRKLAKVAPPRDKITGEDFKKLKKSGKTMKTTKGITKRQEEALARHKKEHGHTKKHIDEMRKLMLKGKTFTEAHKMTMRKVGK